MGITTDLIKAEAAVAKMREASCEHRGPVTTNTAANFVECVDSVALVARAVAKDATDPAIHAVLCMQADLVELAARALYTPGAGQDSMSILYRASAGVLGLAQTVNAE